MGFDEGNAMSRVEEFGKEIRDIYSRLARNHDQALATYDVPANSFSRDKDGFRLGLALGDLLCDGKPNAVVICLGRYDKATAAACVIGSVVDGLKASALFTECSAEQRTEMAQTRGNGLLAILPIIGFQHVANTILAT